MDFFDRVAFVVSTDENLTKAHARFLESQLIRIAKEAGAVTLANVTAPETPRLPEADRSDMAFFIEQLQTVLPILGFDLFRSVKRDAAGRPWASRTSCLNLIPSASEPWPAKMTMASLSSPAQPRGWKEHRPSRAATGAFATN